MDERQVKCKCLRLAIQNTSGNNAEHIVDMARQFSDFVLDCKDHEVINAVRELAKKVTSR